MRYIIISLLVLAAFMSCKNTQQSTLQTENDGQPSFSSNHKDSLFMYMNKSACLGRCPTYIIKVNHSGKAYLNAKDNLPFKGQFEGQFSDNQLDSIKSWLTEINYFQLEKVYDAKITDVPATVTEFHWNDQHHRVRNRWNGPDELKKFEKYLHQIILHNAWKYIED